MLTFTARPWKWIFMRYSAICTGCGVKPDCCRMTVGEQIERPFKAVAIGLVRLYQLTLSPVLPPSCRFYPSCSQYALDALRRKRLFRALGMIVWRLMRCNPFCRGGYDPVDKDEMEITEQA